MQNKQEEQLKKSLTHLLDTLKAIQEATRPPIQSDESLNTKADGSQFDKRDAKEPDALDVVQRAVEKAADGKVPFVCYAATPDHKEASLQVNCCQHILANMICELLCHEDRDIQAAAKKGVLKAMAIQDPMALFG